VKSVSVCGRWRTMTSMYAMPRPGLRHWAGASTRAGQHGNPAHAGRGALRGSLGQHA